MKQPTLLPLTRFEAGMVNFAEYEMMARVYFDDETRAAARAYKEGVVYDPYDRFLGDQIHMDMALRQQLEVLTLRQCHMRGGLSSERGTLMTWADHQIPSITPACRDRWPMTFYLYFFLYCYFMMF